MIVWERTGDWVAWMRQLAPKLTEDVCEVRTAETCWEAVRRRPLAPVAIEYPAGQWQSRLLWTARLASWGSHPKCLIAFIDSEEVGDQLQRATEILSEAGVTHVVASPRDLLRLSDWVHRHEQVGRVRTFPGPKSA